MLLIDSNSNGLHQLKSICQWPSGTVENVLEWNVSSQLKSIRPTGSGIARQLDSFKANPKIFCEWLRGRVENVVKST